MVPVELLEQALAQIAALTVELAAVRVAADQREAELMAKIDALTAKLDALLAKKGVKVPLAAAPTPVSPPAELEARPLPPPKPEPKARSRRGKSPARPVLPEVDDGIVRPARCAHCGGERLSNKDTLESELVDFVQGYLRRRKARRVRCRCADCAQVTAPAIPGACIPKTGYSAAFVAWVLYNKFALHVPLERQLRDLQRMGHPMSSGQLSDLVQRGLGELDGIARAIFTQVMAKPHCHSDATGCPVQVSDKDHTHLGQMFLFGWDDLAAYCYSPDKKGESFAQMVASFQGTLILDASSTHNDALSTGRIVWAGCNAHGLRKFREAALSDPVLGAEGERWIASWFDQERIAREKDLKDTALAEHRAIHTRPLVTRFREWLDAVHPTTIPKTPLHEATRYYVNHWDALIRFLDDPALPLENNFAERCLRAQAIGRKNWLFAGGHPAAQNTAVALSLVQTAKLAGVDPMAYLAWALERAYLCRDGRGLYKDLTPAMYKEAKKRAAG